jgi:putative heme-binding domain-containing protein
MNRWIGIAVCIAWWGVAAFAANSGTGERSKGAWIWSAEDRAPGERDNAVCFRARFMATGGDAIAEISACEEFELFVNGRRVADGRDGFSPKTIRLCEFLVSGENLVAVRVTCGSDRPILRMTISESPSGGLLASTGASWKATSQTADRWQEPDCDDSTWPDAVSAVSADQAHRLEIIRNGRNRPVLVAELISRRRRELTTADVISLSELDRQLAAAGPAESELLQSIMLTLADTGREDAAAHLREMFESFPEIRQHAAEAIARYSLTTRRQREDWRFLVRSLRVVESRQAGVVLRALRKFPERSTKPEWQRQVLLIGLRSEEHVAVEAMKLLSHWADRTINLPAETPVAAQLAAWQAWFAATYPEALPAVLPDDPPGARWKYSELMAELQRQSDGDAARGAEVFERAQCHKCHRFGNKGERMGPDLTDIGGRMQTKELIESILFPSERISDQFQSFTLVTTDGRTLTGIVGQGAGDTLIVLQPNGERATIPRKDVEESAANRQSSMPADLLERLTLSEIADLVVYLKSAPQE